MKQEIFIVNSLAGYPDILDAVVVTERLAVDWHWEDPLKKSNFIASLIPDRGMGGGFDQRSGKFGLVVHSNLLATPRLLPEYRPTQGPSRGWFIAGGACAEQHGYPAFFGEGRYSEPCIRDVFVELSIEKVSAVPDFHAEIERERWAAELARRKLREKGIDEHSGSAAVEVVLNGWTVLREELDRNLPTKIEWWPCWIDHLETVAVLQLHQESAGTGSCSGSLYLPEEVNGPLTGRTLSRRVTQSVFNSETTYEAEIGKIVG